MGDDDEGEMNTKLLLEVKAKILEEPKQFEMSAYFSNASNSGIEIPNCGTAACIGGWAISFSKKLNPNLASAGVVHGWGSEAQKILDLTAPERHQLFYAGNWPEPFRSKFGEAVAGSKEAAQIAADRIDHFIATEGRE